jgi:hypothetical protein
MLMVQRSLYAAAFVVAASLIVVACATGPVPKGYTGPLSYIMDSTKPRGNNGADLFYLASVDGRWVDNALHQTNMHDLGGSYFSAITADREVPAQEETFSIVARTYYSAPMNMPILGIVTSGPFYKISGSVKFTPLEHHSYEVRGILGEDYSAVWIADAYTGEVMDHKIESKKQ